MFSTAHVQEFPTEIPGLHAFRITGAVDRDDMKAMSHYMLDVFTDHDKVDMLLAFETQDASTAGSGLSWEAVEAQVKSLTNVRNYVVANAPGGAGGLVETMGKIMPVQARSFDTEAEALAWLRAQPPLPA